MSKSFRPWKIDEPMFLPLTVQDFVGADHLAHFVLNLVRESIDLTPITGTYGSERGQPPFDPVMMTALLLYAYCCGIYSSRRIAKACRERVDFMSLVGLDTPDFRTISDFRKRHLQALGDLFTQVLLLCEKAGLVKLGHVALDGTKIKANASKHKAMSYGRMEERIKELEAEVAEYLKTAQAADAEEDKLYGSGKTGEEMPAWIADKQRRIEKIRNAKAELEAEAKAAAEAKRKAEVEKREAEEQEGKAREGKRGKGRPAQPPPDVPAAKAQKNFTDPESRIMKSKDGFVQAYNAQIAVDAEAQIIVAQYVTQSASDSGQLVPLTDAIEANLGRKPRELSADAGYCSEGNLAALEERSIDGYVATGRARDAVAGKGKAAATDAAQLAETPVHVEATQALTAQNTAAQGTVDCGQFVPPTDVQLSAADCSQANDRAVDTATGQATDAVAGDGEVAAAAQPAKTLTRVEAMRAKIKAGGHQSPYRLRKQLPEPVFGQIKEGRGFRQFLMRGFENVRGEWAMLSTAHNILKLADKVLKPAGEVLKRAHRRILSTASPMAPAML
jgi:transposase